MNNTFSPLTSMSMKIFLFCVSAVISSQKKRILFVNTKSMLSLVTIHRVPDQPLRLAWKIGNTMFPPARGYLSANLNFTFCNYSQLVDDIILEAPTTTTTGKQEATK